MVDSTKKAPVRSFLPKSGSRSVLSKPPPSAALNTQLRKVSETEIKSPGRLRRLSSFTNTITTPIGNAFRSMSRVAARHPSSSSLAPTSADKNRNVSKSKLGLNTTPTPKKTKELPKRPTPSKALPAPRQPSMPPPPIPRNHTISFLPIPADRVASSSAKVTASRLTPKSAAIANRVPTPSKARSSSAQISPISRLPVSRSDSNLYQSKIPHAMRTAPLQQNAVFRNTVFPKPPLTSNRMFNASRSTNNLNLNLNKPLAKIPIAKTNDKENHPVQPSNELPTTVEEVSPPKNEQKWEFNCTSTTPREAEKHREGSTPGSDNTIYGTANYAFNARKMTHSMALKSASGPDGSPLSRGGSIRRLQALISGEANQAVLPEGVTRAPARRTSNHVIPQYTLMQPVQPESPPQNLERRSSGNSEKLAALASGSHLISPPQTRGLVAEPSPLRKSFELNDSSSPINVDRTPTVSRPSAEETAALVYAQHASSRQPIAYWSGRYSALRDRLRNESIETAIVCAKDPREQLKARLRQNHLSSSKPFSRTPRYTGITDEEETSIVLRIFELLETSCLTKEAVDSLVTFKEKFARVHRVPALLRIRGESQGGVTMQREVGGLDLSWDGRENARIGGKGEESGRDGRWTGTFVDKLLLGSTKTRISGKRQSVARSEHQAFI